MIKISVIIVQFGNKDEVDACIASLPKSRSLELIVIDNTHDNIGFSKACNQGALRATGKYLLFLNPDTKIIGDAVEHMSQVLDDDSSIGIVGPQLVDGEGKPYLSFTRLPSRFGSFVTNSFVDTALPKNYWSSRFWYRDEPLLQDRDVGSVSGAALIIRSELFNILNGFDESFFMYFEDADICRRAIEEGYRVRYVPKAEVMHIGGTATIPVRNQASFWFRRSRFKYYSKHFGKWYGYLLETWLRPQEYISRKRKK